MQIAPFETALALAACTERASDVRLDRSWRIGPVLSGSIGRFTNIAVNGTPSTDFETVLYAWAALGFRGAFDL